MKRYEKMSNKEIFEFIKGEIDECKSCIAKEYCNKYEYGACVNIKLAYLGQEIKKVPRIATINTVEELKQARDGHNRVCNHFCEDCKYRNGEFVNCFNNYLAEGIEVEE